MSQYILTENEANAVVEPSEWPKKYNFYLYNNALKKVNDPDLAKDLVQETFLAALESRQRFKRYSSERTWLTGILKNRIFLVYRKGRIK